MCCTSIPFPLINMECTCKLYILTVCPSDDTSNISLLLVCWIVTAPSSVMLTEADRVSWLIGWRRVVVKEGTLVQVYTINFHVIFTLAKLTYINTVQYWKTLKAHSRYSTYTCSCRYSSQHYNYRVVCSMVSHSHMAAIVSAHVLRKLSKDLRMFLLNVCVGQVHLYCMLFFISESLFRTFFAQFYKVKLLFAAVNMHFLLLMATMVKVE